MEYFKSNSEDRLYVPALSYNLTTRPKPPQIYSPFAEEEREILIEELILLNNKKRDNDYFFKERTGSQCCLILSPLKLRHHRKSGWPVIDICQFLL